jgi:SAM-dependent methyltransferase
MQKRFTPEEQAAQLRKPHGKDAGLIAEYMATQNVKLYAEVLKLLQVKSGQHILELGCGEAVLAGEIVSRTTAEFYTGIDYSPEMIDMAKLKWANVPKITLLQGEIAAMPFGDNTFDEVFAINVVYFWDEPSLELAEIKRVMKPGSRLLLGYRPKDKMQYIPFTARQFILYEPHELEEMLVNNGFETEQTLLIDEEPRLIAGQLKPMQGCVSVFKKK